MNYLSDTVNVNADILKKDDVLHLFCTKDESIPVMLFQTSVEVGFKLIPHICNGSDIEIGFELGRMSSEINDDIIILVENSKLSVLVGKTTSSEHEFKALTSTKEPGAKRGPKGPRKSKNEPKSEIILVKPEKKLKPLPEIIETASPEIKVPSGAISLLKEINVADEDMAKICKAARKAQGGVIGFEIQLQMIFGKERGTIQFNKLRNIFDKLKKIVGNDF